MSAVAQQSEVVKDQGEAFTKCIAKAAERETELRSMLAPETVRGSRCEHLQQSPVVWNYTAEVEVDTYGDGRWRWQHYENYTYSYSDVDRLKNSGGCSQCELFAGNPINLVTSNKYQADEDIARTGSSQLTVRRYFNGDLQNRPASALGSGWRMTYDRRIYMLEGVPPGVAIAYRQDGSANYFDLSADSWVGDKDVDRALTQDIDNGSFIGWTLTHPDDSRERYDVDGKLLSITYKNGATEALSYDTAGRLESVTDQTGRTLFFTYDAEGRLSAVSEGAGQVVIYGYDDDGVLVTANYPESGSKTYHYDEAGLTGGPATGTPKLTGITDENGTRFASFYYDSTGRVTVSTHALNADRVEVTYGTGQSVTIINPLGLATTRNYSVNNRSAHFSGASAPSSLCPSCASTALYDSRGFKTKSTDFSGVATNYGHDDRGLETRRFEASNRPVDQQRTTQTDWRASFRVPTERRTYSGANTLVAKTSWTYNNRGQALTATQTNPATLATRTVTTTYCETADVTAGTCPLVGLVTTVNGPRTDADTTTYTYYVSDDATCAASPTTCPHRKGDLWKVTNALGQVTETLRYDGAGRVLLVKNPNDVTTDFEYHPRGWLTARKVRGIDDAAETDDQITRIEYWPTGLVKKVTQPDGVFTAYGYDAAHRLIDIADNAGNTIHYTLDNAGNRVQEDTKDAGGTLKRTLSRVYNQLGQLTTQADADANPTDFAYDPNGNLDTVTDAFGRVTDSDYDPLNRLVRTLQDVGGIEAETEFEYDAIDNLTKVTDPKGLDTIYAHNGFGDLTQVTSPDIGTTTYTYDSAGNRKTQTDARGVTATYTYDALNRVTSIAYSTAGPDITHVYDTASPACATGETFAVGRLATIVDASGSTDYCYNRFGNMVRKMQTTNGQAFTLRYAYTKAGQLSSMTYPDGTVVDYVRDGQGQTIEVGVSPQGGARAVLLDQAAYAPFGPVTGWDWGNGRSLSRSYNQNYQPETIFDSAPGGLSLHYGFDAVGNLTDLKDGSQTTPLAQYDYDALGRLAVTRDGPTGTPIETYVYDATGNRTELTNAGGTATYTYPVDSHRLASVGGIARTYDAVGNMLSIGGTAKEFVYDAANRLSQVKQSSAVIMRYAYNGRGERVRRYPSETSTDQTYTVYDEAGRWIGDYDNTGAAIQQAIWLDNLPVGLLVDAGPGQELHYVEVDHLGTPRVVIDPTRDVAVWKWDAKGEVFGNTVPDQDPDSDGTAFVFDMRFPGQRYDAASGLNYNYFRDYEPVAGRYAQSDPIGLNGGYNSYGYVGGNPLNWFDSYGLDWIEYTGRTMRLYAGDYGNRTKIIRQCEASSGRNAPSINYDYRTSQAQHIRDWGPTPEGRYRINLVPDPNRIARVLGGYLTPSPSGGIERIPPGGEHIWGTWRARLLPAPSTETYGRTNMYLHDSNKGETSGCIETCSGLLDNLLKLRNVGVHFIDVGVNYDGIVPTGGGL